MMSDVTVKGREVRIEGSCEHPSFVFIAAAKGYSQYLWPDGEWRETLGKAGTWDAYFESRTAAEAFLKAHADPPAANGERSLEAEIEGEWDREIEHLKTRATDHELTARYQRLLSEGARIMQERNALREQVLRLEKIVAAYQLDGSEIEQVLGKALNYPLLYVATIDGQEAIVAPDYPGAKPTDQVCVGEHVPASIAAEAARSITALREQLAAVERELDIAATDLAARKSDLTARDDEVRRFRGVLEQIEGGYVEADENDLDAWIVEMQQMARAALASTPPPPPTTVAPASLHPLIAMAQAVAADRTAQPPPRTEEPRK